MKRYIRIFLKNGTRGEIKKEELVCASKILDKSDISQEEKSEKDKVINLEEYRKRA